MTKILLVEDEESIRGFLKINLERNSFEVIEAETGEEGIEKALREKPEIIILDVMLPGIDGFQVCSRLRKEFPNVGIIMLTAKGIGISEDESSNNKNKLMGGPFIIDLYSQKLLKNNKEIDVTPKEYMLMKLFIENPNKAFTRDELLNLIWGYNFFGDPKIIDVNIRRLRSKIEDDSSNPQYIETVWGIGYRWKG